MNNFVVRYSSTPLFEAVKLTEKNECEHMRNDIAQNNMKAVYIGIVNL